MPLHPFALPPLLLPGVVAFRVVAERRERLRSRG